MSIDEKQLQAIYAGLGIEQGGRWEGATRIESTPRARPNWLTDVFISAEALEDMKRWGDE